MIKEQTPLEKVTELLQNIKKLETAKDLAYQLDQLLPSSLRKDNGELSELYLKYGIVPDSDETQSILAHYPAMQTAKKSLFKNQENFLKACILETLGFRLEPSSKEVSEQ